MSAHPDYINDDDALLMLYASGELPAVHAGTVRQRLQTDPEFARRLAEIEASLATFEPVLHRADLNSALAERSESLRRTLAGNMREWQSDRTRNVVEMQVARKVRRGHPVWLYPLAAAAVVAVGLGTWYLALPAADAPQISQRQPRSGEGRRGDGAVTLANNDGMDLALAEVTGDSLSGLERELEILEYFRDSLQ